MEFSLENAAGQLVGIVSLQGRLDARNCKSLQKLYAQWLEKTPFLVFNCSQLDFVDSSGLGIIVGCLRKAIEKEGDLRLAGLSDKVAMVFELTQATRLFSIFASTPEAVASFGNATDTLKQR